MNTVMTSREEMMLSKLLRFYKQDPQHLNILAAISKQKTIISLREMDYAVTNYSDNNKVIYKMKFLLLVSMCSYAIWMNFTINISIINSFTPIITTKSVRINIISLYI